MSQPYQTSVGGQRQARRPNSAWVARYGDKHHLRRLKSFGEGVIPPKRVRIYHRGHHYLLQWWDPHAKRSLNVRVDGDLIDAIARARDIEIGLENFRSGGQILRKLKHDELVMRYVTNLSQRADAAELAPGTAARYGSALEHYRAFVSRPEIKKSFPDVVVVNRDFQVRFAAYLQARAIKAEAAVTSGRPVRSPGFVLDTTRAMYEWAADPNRGALLPVGFHNPFRGVGKGRRSPSDLLGEPDITIDMAVSFVQRCDAFQLRLFGALMLYGLRAAEPVFLLAENIREGWLKVPCLPEFAYATKGIRAKTFPLLPPMIELLGHRLSGSSPLLFVRRAVSEGRERPRLPCVNFKEMLEEFRRRCTARRADTAAEREAVRDGVLRDAGGLNYDQIEHEFRGLARNLEWQPQATLKDLRHLFSSCLENAGVPLFYRRYFMGQSPGRTPIVTYTHLNQVGRQYQKAVDNDLGPLVVAISERARRLGRQVA